MEDIRTPAKTVELTGRLLDFKIALESEIDEIKKSGQSSTLLTSGRKVTSNGADYWYCYKVEYLTSMPADTPCKLIIDKKSYDVTVVSFKENEIVVSSNAELPDNMSTARLENGSTILLERLIRRIETNSEKKNPAGDRMLPEDGKAPSFSKINSVDIIYDENLTDAQRKAIDSALSNNITYIWGPPGTGKTKVIGDIICNLYKNHRSVLVVSHTNTAVNGAIEQVIGKKGSEEKLSLREDGSCPVLRLGIRQKDLKEEVLLENHIKKLGEDLYKCKEKIEIEQKKNKESIKVCMTTIDKYKWAYSFDIKKLETAFDEESSAYDNFQICKRDYKEQEKKADKYFREHEGVQKLKGYKCEEERLAKKYNKQADLLKQKEDEILICEKTIEIANEELAKYKIHASLTKEISGKMPESFWTKKLSEYDALISAAEDELQDLANRENELRSIISAGQRNAITAFLSRKNIENAETEMVSNNEKQKELNGSVISFKKTKRVYQDQLEEIKSLKLQLKDVITSESEGYWITKKEEAEDSVQRAREIKEDTRKLLDELMVSLSDLSVLIELSNDEAIEYANLVKKTKSLKEKCDYLQKKYNDAKTKSENFISEVIKSGSRFLSSDIKGNSDKRALLNKLTSSLDEIKTEIAGKSLDEMEKSLSEYQRISGELSSQLQEVEEKINNLTREAINKAEIVGATLAKTYLDDFVQERQFDTVILDEASMAPIPALWCASYLAKQNIVIVGDFIQLPPIVMSKMDIAKKWLGKDIFEISGMQAKAKKNATAPDNFIMLDEQFRMESDIAAIANMYYGEYKELKSNDDKRIEARNKFYSWFPGDIKNGSVEMVDTSDLHAWVTAVPRGQSHSRFNSFSAALCVEMAFSYITNYIDKIGRKYDGVEAPKVIIVAPYRPHIDRIKLLIDIGMEKYNIPKDLGLIEAGTIHSFQGNEADIVIFDLVIDEPHWKAGIFSNDPETNENLSKMFNVAITRAKFKLFVVGNIIFCRKRTNRNVNALGKLLAELENNNVKINNAKEMFPNLFVSIPRSFKGEDITDSGYFVCQESEYYEYLLKDIESVKDRMIIFSPFITENRLSILLPELHDCVENGKEIVVITRPLSDRNKSEVVQYQKCEDELVNIGVIVIHKKGMHEKIVLLDNDTVWIGSLNTLSFAGNTGEFMTRISNEEYTTGIIEMYSIPNIQTAIDSTYELSCPICQSQMIYGESDKGGYYWKCSNCDYGRDFKQQYPIGGVLTCHCGSSYHFDMKNQPRWVCDSNPRHYQIMRKGDLKLEKMAALIPTKKDRKAVDAYFEAKVKEKESKKKTSSKKAVPKAKVEEAKQLNLSDFGIM